MSAKLAKLLKEARTGAGLTQQALADLVPGLSASDISKSERNEKEPTVDQLKAIAKATGVTQKSLVEAASAKTKAATTTTSKAPAATKAKTGTAAKTSTAKSTATKTGTAKTTTTKTTSSKSTASKTTASKSTAATTSVKLTAAEKKLVELYRKADSDSKKAALKALKGEESEINEILSSILGGAMSAFLK